MSAVTISIDGQPVCIAAPGGSLTLSVQESVNNRATAQFRILDFAGEWASRLPQGFLFKEIVAMQGSKKVFGGIVTQQDNSTADGQVYIEISLRCVDYTSILDRRIIRRIFEPGESLAGIIAALIAIPGPSGDTASGAGITNASANATAGSLHIPSRLIFDGVSISEAISQAAALVGAHWWVDWDKDIHAGLLGGSAPFNIDSTDPNCPAGALTSSVTTDRYKNSGYTPRDIQQMPPLIETTDGDGNARGVFTVFEVANSTPLIWRRTARYAQATVTITGVPAAGASLTVDGETYTFRTTLAAANDVLIGRTAVESARNLAYAFNGVGSWAGIYFHADTTAHSTCEAAYRDFDQIIIRFRDLGNGNGTAISGTGAVSPDAATLTGGAAGTNEEQRVAVAGEGGADWYFTPGTTSIEQDVESPTLAIGETLEVRYRRIFSNWVQAQDDSAVSTYGRWDVALDQEQSSDGLYALQVIRAAIRKYGVIPTLVTYEVSTLKQAGVLDLIPGMAQAVKLHNFDGSALVTDITRSWFFALDTWQCRSNVSAIGYPAGSTAEPWERWGDLLLPSGVGSTSGGSTGATGTGGGATAADTPVPGPITNITGISISYADPMRANITASADLPATLNGFDGCEAYAKIDGVVYPLGHIPHPVGASGPFQIVIDVERPWADESWTFYFVSRNDKRAAELVTTGTSQSPNFTRTLTARPADLDVPAPNVTSVTGTVDYNDAGEWRVKDITVVFPAGRANIGSFAIELDGPATVQVTGDLIPPTSGNYTDASTFFSRPTGAAETWKLRVRVRSKGGALTASPTESAALTVNPIAASGSTMNVTGPGGTGSPTLSRVAPYYNVDGVEETSIFATWRNPSNQDAERIEVQVRNPDDPNDDWRTAHTEILADWGYGVDRDLLLGPWPTSTETTQVRWLVRNQAGDAVASPVVVSIAITAGAGALNLGRASSSTFDTANFVIASGKLDVKAGGITDTEIGDVNASKITGSISASQIGSVNASSIVGSITASQIGSVNAGSITGSITAGQITSITAGQVTGSIVASQIGSVNASAIAGSIVAAQIGSVNATAITGLIAATQINSITAGQITGSIGAGQISSVNASSIVGTITAAQIASVNASAIAGTIGAAQISSVNASSISGLISGTQINTVAATQITGALTSGQIASVAASTITGSITSAQISSVNASAITGTLSASQISSVSATSITGSITAGQISSITASQITGVVVTSQLADQILNTQRLLASDIGIIRRVATLPTLPDGNYPVGATILRTSDKKLYKNVSGSWLVVNPSDDITGTLTSTDIVSVSASTITGLIIASQIQSIAATQITGTITSGQIGSVSASSITGTITSGQIGSVAASTITGTLNASQIASVNATAITGLISSTQIGSVSASTITGSISASQIGSVNASSITGTISASQIGTISGSQITAIVASTITVGQISDSQISSIAASKIQAGTISASILMTSPALQITGAAGFTCQIDSSNGIKLTNTSQQRRVDLVNGSVVVTNTFNTGYAATMIPSIFIAQTPTAAIGIDAGIFETKINIVGPSSGVQIRPSGISADNSNAIIDFSGSGQQIKGSYITVGTQLRFASYFTEGLTLASFTTSYTIPVFNSAGFYLGKIPVFY